ncbi:hypothetical protein [Catellatospora tritici]|uniref:hypothetical protein n=1 Tax=Catellatospora tritici TaxID=2851566 RepID=UPI001C2D4161|nr:hypothetical protein [Catellatospora tritici]MBV1852728.1 hypothetical protein [Catellatospora tritici]
MNVPGTRPGGALTADMLRRALAALGAPVAKSDQPPDDDIPALLGALTATVEAAVHDHLNEVRELERFTAAYGRQLAGHALSDVQLVAQRLGVASDQLRPPSVVSGHPVPAIAGAADAAQVAHALLSYQISLLDDPTAAQALTDAQAESLHIALEASRQARAHLDTVAANARQRGLHT